MVIQSQRMMIPVREMARAHGRRARILGSGPEKERRDAVSTKDSKQGGDSRAAPTEEEDAMFAREMAGVRPLPGARRPTLPPAPAPSGPRRPAQPRPALPALTEIECRPEAWGYLAHDAGPALLRELRAGQRQPAASLDLHGLTTVEAERALNAFVAQSQQAGRRVVLVVHGRGNRSGPGGPVLGDLVRSRLSAAELASRILAVSHAPPALGGTGATVILLRKR
jgi:DNA-nicking Smr family endonuclease